MSDKNEKLKPNDRSDLGQAEVYVKQYCKYVRYVRGIGFLVYRDGRWIASDLQAQRYAQELTVAQLAEAEAEAAKLLSGLADTDDLSAALKEAGKYRAYAVQRRKSSAISAVLREVAPMLELPIEMLDADGFILNTPAGTIDLREGVESMRAHSPEDYCTKITAVSPGEDGADVWQQFLNTICCGDTELITYLQQVCGLAAIGQVYVEVLVIAVGNGRNGKSTLFNSVARVLGDYAGNLSADVLTQECHRNAKPELAELRGKRLIIASELKSDTRLSDSMIKQLCSTDLIYAEKKYRDPFAFVPSHTVILCTNHLPTVTANDDGIWRRLIVIPFDAKIEPDTDIKNFADYLYNQAGPAILAWIIEGARQVIANQFKLTPPPCVTEAIEEYRHANDWFSQFLLECCEVGQDKSISSSVLYRTYRGYCEERYETAQSTAAFYGALAAAGFSRKLYSGRSFIMGLALKCS